MSPDATPAPQWEEIELTLQATLSHAEPYTRVEVWADFTLADGTALRRPAFWDGGSTWRIRFASPVAAGVITWKPFANVDDSGLRGPGGSLQACPARTASRFSRHGFLRMSPGGRSAVHADGKAFLLVSDTTWALPWRATAEQVQEYAAYRAAQGFNATLLMTVQPDMGAVGPEERTADLGFLRGFEDLHLGRLEKLKPGYFQELDGLLSILQQHDIVPIHQPVFHGFGWQGKEVAGKVVSGPDYARFCRYLVARYGARPAIWLVSGDGQGLDPGVDPAGAEVQAWDCYAQPTGIHYAPHAPSDAWQDRAWLDFQWCQTGHGGDHVQEKVAFLWRNQPAKGVANAEPTYENIGWPGKASGWWQGHEAWANLCAGGTMGVFYGAGSLWQWKHRREEPHIPWCEAAGCDWRDALRFEGATYVGIVGRILGDLPVHDLEPNWTSWIAQRGCSRRGELYLLYAPQGGHVGICDPEVPAPYRVHCARTGRLLKSGSLDASARNVHLDFGIPTIVIFWNGYES